MALNPEQFGPWANTGPVHARLAYERGGGDAENIRQSVHLVKESQVPVPEHVHAGQGQFFDPNKVARPEPHQQTPAAFAADSRSWWHGRFQKSPRLTKGGSDEGFHAGSRGSAIKRLEANAQRRGVGETPARMFPLRLVGRTGSQEPGGEATRGSSPEEPGFDRQRHKGLSDRGRGYFYKNEVEDPGHISIGVPRREGFLATHRDLVEHAQSEGKFVHPNIAWAAKKGPQHTGEDVMAYKRRRPGDESRQGPQMGLVEALPAGSKEIEGMHDAMKRKRLTTERRSYSTESGDAVHVYKLAGDTGWSKTYG